MSIEADLLLRVSSNRCVFGAPPAYSGRGAPRKHGVKLKLNDPTTCPAPHESVEFDDAQYGRVQLRHCPDVHFKQSPTRPMALIRVEVLWLVWLGQTMPDLKRIGRLYLRRFAVEHWYRFAKQRLHWTQPQLSSTHASERWSLLVVLMTWQLWLARHDCEDAPLPWQSAHDTLAPGRVTQVFASILVAIGTPAKAPKPRGKSPGRAIGERTSPRQRYPTVKKRSRRRKKGAKPPKPVLPSTA